MPEFNAHDLVSSARRMRLDTLVRLRWLAIAGQTGAVLFVALVLDFALPLTWSLAFIGLSAVLNLALKLRYPVSHRLGDAAASSLLAFDVLQLAALLYLTGGLENPFAMLFLAPVLISATALPPRRTLRLGVLAVVAASLLALFYQPLPWYPGEDFSLPLSYRIGVWAAIALGISFTGVYAWRVAEEARQLAQALAATELVLTREQHLSQLDGLAAAAAHELGTPLATIALVAKELEQLGPAVGPIAEDIALISTQAARCREILGKITSLGDEGSGPLESMSLGVLIEEVVGPHRPFETAIDVRREGSGPEPICRRNPGLLYGLGNLVENAVDFAGGLVEIIAQWDAVAVTVQIKDDGPGFPPEVMARFGEPYVTTRGGANGPFGSGLGLGIFIAKTLLERTGAAVFVANASDRGALVTITWPRNVFERGALLQKPPLEASFPL
jgi:two-component system, sensor histidine kinase RegB